MISYLVGLLLLYLSLFLSTQIPYHGNLVLELPIIIPMVFSIIAIGVSVHLFLGSSYPYFFRTGVMSLVAGITLFVFGFISYSFNAGSIVWAGSLVLGVIFIAGAIFRLLVQGGLSAYRRFRRGETSTVEETSIPSTRLRNRKIFLITFGAILLIFSIQGVISNITGSRPLASFGDIISFAFIAGGIYFVVEYVRIRDQS